MTITVTRKLKIKNSLELSSSLFEIEILIGTSFETCSPIVIDGTEEERKSCNKIHYLLNEFNVLQWYRYC